MHLPENHYQHGPECSIWSPLRLDEEPRCSCGLIALERVAKAARAAVRDADDGKFMEDAGADYEALRAALRACAPPVGEEEKA